MIQKDFYTEFVFILHHNKGTRQTDSWEHSLLAALVWSPSLACVCGEWRAGFPGEWAVCREAGEGPATEGELGQFLCTGDGMARLALVNGDPTSRPGEEGITKLIKTRLISTIRNHGGSSFVYSLVPLNYRFTSSMNCEMSKKLSFIIILQVISQNNIPLNP